MGERFEESGNPLRVTTDCSGASDLAQTDGRCGYIQRLSRSA
jgi:hypothetical protein